MSSADDKTRMVRRSSSTPPAEAPASSSMPPPPVVADGHTVLVRPGSRPSKPLPEVPGGTPASDDFPETGPLVGWLVVVKGPGRGRAVTLGYGSNSIGRDLDNRVPLPFNDEQISRKKHAIITYDPRGRKFYIQHGESNNLSYVGETPVLAPMVLQGGEMIRFGDRTEVKFVPLCGEEFEWEPS